MAIIATCSYTLVDLYDPIQQDAMPDFSPISTPVIDEDFMLILDGEDSDQFSIVDGSLIYIGGSSYEVVDGSLYTHEPIGALWLDTSLVPNQLKRWDGKQWSIVNDTAGIISRLTEAELLITDEAIVGTVRSSEEYIGDLSEKVSSTVYESKMQLLDAEILLKASSAEVLDIETRLAQAEQIIEPTSITSIVRASEEYRGDMSGVSDQFVNLQDALGNKLDASALADLATVSYVQSVQSTEIEQRADAINLAVSQETIRAVAAENGIKEFTDSARTYFSFLLDGMRLGKQGSEFSTLLGNEKLSFMQGGDEVAYIQYNRLYINMAEVQRVLTIGNIDEDRGDVVGFTDIRTNKYADGTGGISAIWRAE